MMSVYLSRPVAEIYKNCNAYSKVTEMLTGSDYYSTTSSPPTPAHA